MNQYIEILLPQDILCLVYLKDCLQRALNIIKEAGNMLHVAPDGLGELMNLTDRLSSDLIHALLEGYAEGMAASALSPMGIKLSEPAKQLARFAEAKAKSLEYLTEMLALRTVTPPSPQPTPTT